MDLARINGTMDQSTMVNGTIIRFQELGFINGLMEECTKVSGLTTIWRGLGSIPGTTVGPSKDNTKTIKNTVTASTDGLMVESTQVTG